MLVISFFCLVCDLELPTFLSVWGGGLVQILHVRALEAYRRVFYQKKFWGELWLVSGAFPIPSIYTRWIMAQSWEEFIRCRAQFLILHVFYAVRYPFVNIDQGGHKEKLARLFRYCGKIHIWLGVFSVHFVCLVVHG